MSCGSFQLKLHSKYKRILFFAVNKEQPFKDKCFLYRFKVDEESSVGLPQTEELAAANEHIRESLNILLHRAPDATLRMILRKP